MAMNTDNYAMAEVEKLRESVQEHKKRWLAIGAVVNIVVISIVYSTAIHTHSVRDQIILLALLSFFTTFICWTVWTYAAIPYRLRFQFMFKQRVVLPELQLVEFKDMEYAVAMYETAQGANFTPDSKPCIFPRTSPFITEDTLNGLKFKIFNYMEGKDFIRANYKSYQFTRENLILQYSSGSGKSSRLKTIFNGAFISVKCKKAYPARLIIYTFNNHSFYLPKRQTRLLDILGNDAKEKLAADGITFNHDFCVAGDAPSKSTRAMLSPHHMEWLKQIDTLFPGDIMLLLEDRSLYVFTEDTFDFDAFECGKQTIDKQRLAVRDNINTFVKQLDALIKSET
jgi:hypothetical protein